MLDVAWFKRGLRVVEHAALRAARDRLSRIRAAKGFAGEALRVFRQHGSRQRRFAQDDPMAERAPAATREAKARRRMALDIQAAQCKAPDMKTGSQGPPSSPPKPRRA